MNNFPYRPGVNAIVINKNNEFLLVQKQSYGKNQWDFPGGGIEENENPKEGVLRELEEELGTTKFSIVKKSPFINKFDWPIEAQEKGFKKQGIWWQGQEKHQFIVRFEGNKKDIHPQEKEIKQVKWVSYEELKNHLVFEGQWENAKKTIEEANLIA